MQAAMIAANLLWAVNKPLFTTTESSAAHRLAGRLFVYLAV